MAARVKTWIFQIGKTGYVHITARRLESRGISISSKKYKQASKLWKPERREIKLHIAFWEITINLRRIIA